MRELSRTLLLIAVPLTLAACGGSSSGSGDPTSGSYNPAHTTLKDAGLQVCSESQSQSLPDEPGAQLTKTYYVAPDCHGAKVTPNVVTVYQFSSQQSVDSAYTAINAAAPANAATEKYGPLVIVVTGPNAHQYLASIDTALKATQGGSNPPTTT